MQQNFIMSIKNLINTNAINHVIAICNVWYSVKHANVSGSIYFMTNLRVIVIEAPLYSLTCLSLSRATSKVTKISNNQHIIDTRYDSLAAI